MEQPPHTSSNSAAPAVQLSSSTAVQPSSLAAPPLLCHRLDSPLPWLVNASSCSPRLLPLLLQALSPFLTLIKLSPSN